MAKHMQLDSKIDKEDLSFSLEDDNPYEKIS